MLTRLTASVPPDEISTELMPRIEELGLVDNCRQLAEEGYTIIENVASPEFTDRLRDTMLRTTPVDESGSGSGMMMLGKDPAYAEAVLNPKVMAMAEFSVGRGGLIGSVISTVHAAGRPALALLSDQEVFPAPFPAHNMMLTACWATDEFSREGGCTRVVPGTHRHLRHPTEDEVAADTGAIPIACPAGSVALWDGRVWHGNYTRELAGKRVVLHATYYRLLMRPGENYSDVADELIAAYGAPMSQLLGREDFLDKKDFDYVNDYDTFVETLNNAKT